MGRRIKKVICSLGIILLAVLCSIFTGCGVNGGTKSSNQNKQLMDSLRQWPKPPEESHVTEKIGIYVDVTPSMKGFLGMQTINYKSVVGETRYSICLNELSNIMSSEYDSNLFMYYRVDTPLWLTEENVLKEARKDNYYDESENFAEDRSYQKIDLIEEDGESYGSWCLTNALLHCRNDDFSIIVTDFYENERVTDSVINALKQNVTLEDSGGKTVGIVGIRSEFAGQVYDLLPNGKLIEYGLVEGEVTKEDICYRQFYVIVIGNPKEVGKFCANLKDNMNLEEEDIKYTVFYENEKYALDYRDYQQCYSRNKDNRSRLWPDGKVLINGNTEFEVYEYHNQTDVWRDILVSYQAEKTFLEGVLDGERLQMELPGGQAVEVVEVPHRIDSKTVSCWNSSNSCYEIEDNLTDFFQMREVYYSPEEGQLYVWFRVSNKKLPLSSLKLSCHICFDYPCGADKMEWAELWNLPNNEVDCEKTRGLKEYFNALKGRMPQRNDVLLDFVFYLNIT